jgi:hypothetical protein
MAPFLLAALALTPTAAASPSDTQGRLSVTLTCSELTIAGRGEGVVGGAAFSQSCSPSAPMAMIDLDAIGDPGIMPWTIRLIVTDARGSTTTCAERGTGLPARLVCRGIGDPEDLVSIQAVRSAEPD